MQFWKWEFTFGWVQSEAVRSTAGLLCRPITTDHICWAAWNSPWQHSLSVPTKAGRVEEVLRSANRTQWGGQGVEGKMRYDPCLSYEMHPSVVTPEQISPFFFFPPVFNYIAGLKFTHTTAGTPTQRRHVHVDTLFWASAKRPNVVTLSIVFRKIVRISAAEGLLPWSTFIPNAGWQFHKTKRELPGNRGAAAASMQRLPRKLQLQVTPFRSSPEFQVVGKQQARQGARLYLLDGPHPSGALARREPAPSCWTLAWLNWSGRKTGRKAGSVEERGRVRDERRWKPRKCRSSSAD